MEYIKINEHVAFGDLSKDRMEMFGLIDPEEDFFRNYIKFIIEYNTKHVSDSIYFKDRNTFLTVKICDEKFNNDNIVIEKDGSFSENAFRFNEVMQLYRSGFFTNVKSDVKKRIIVSNINIEGQDYFILFTNTMDDTLYKRFKPAEKTPLLEKVIQNYYISEFTMMYKRYSFLIKGVNDLIEILEYMMKKRKYKILNYSSGNREENAYNFNFRFDMYPYEDKYEWLRKINGISYKDIINKDKEKISIIDHKSVKAIAIKEAFK
ncbi:hypothetical protein [Staphylococcus phage vB_StaM_SA1]|nr:hypothetical protein [Staphylococcus phage vB_StaM_SA1]